jgi:hypothetical protein
MTKSEFQEFANELLLYCAASSTFLVHLHHSGIRRALEQFIPKDDCDIKFARADRTVATFHLYRTLDLAKSDKRFNVYYLRSTLMAVVSIMGDALTNEKLYNRSPEFQFFRHLRNAISHGNRFYFKKGEPRYHSQFKSLVLNPALQGTQQVLFDFIKPGDVIDLVRYLRDNV